jgi:O-antigen/teichoic acid export membrane protein
MLIRQTVLYLPAQLLAPAVQFVAAVAWTHLMPPAEYGTLLLIMALQELVYVAGLSWWTLYAGRFVAAHADGGTIQTFQRAENGALLIAIPLQCLAMLAVLACFGTPPSALLVVAAVTFAVTRSLANHLAERARAEGRIGLFSFMQIAMALLGFGGAHVAMVTLGPKPEWALFALAAVQTVAALAAAVLLRLASARVAFDRAILLHAVRFGGPLLLSGLLAWGSMHGIRLLIERFEGAVALGLFAVGWGLGQRVVGVGAMVVTSAGYPLAVAKHASGDTASALDQVARNGALLLALLLPLLVGTALVTEPMVKLLVAEPFHAMTIAVLPLAALAATIRNLRVHWADQVLLLAERTDIALIMNSVEAVTTCVGCVIGLMVHGVVGACIGCVVGALVGAVCGFGMATLRFKLPVLWGLTARICLATAAMALTLLLLPAPAGIVGLALHIAAGVGTYAAILALSIGPPALMRLRLRQG